MNRRDIYRQLAERMVLYVDLVKIPQKENGEPLVQVPVSKFLQTREIDSETLELIEKPILVRKTVSKLLVEASKIIAEMSDDMALEIVYGHRSIAIQRTLFEKYRKMYEKKYQGNELLEVVHRNIAVPEVAGHPAGAAVDIRILKNGKPLNMGTHIWEFNPNSYTFSPFISKQAWNNRRLLRDVMKQVGFAPYDGEWWHFSYGDKEWAKYYNKPFAIYSQLENH
jgi:D-alanyl-D-alanine dipeptidase